MASFVVDLILLIVFAAIGIYAMMRSGFGTPQGVVMFVVGLIFLVAAVIVGLSMAGIGWSF